MTSTNLPATFHPSSPRAALESEVRSTLPLLLVSLLERRYLGLVESAWRVDPARWFIEPRPDDRSYPLLREIVGIGRPHHRDEWVQAMPYVLAACHDMGHALIMTLHGQGDQHRLYFGGRRIVGAGARSTQDYLDAQASAFNAYVPEMQMGTLAGVNRGDLPAMTDLLETAPVMAAVTGIPSGRGSHIPSDAQSLDRLVRAVGNQRYVLTVVAEPLEPWVVDETLDACRRLQSEIHEFARRTSSHVEGRSQGESHRQHQDEDEGRARTGKENLPLYVYGLATFLNTAGIALTAATGGAFTTVVGTGAIGALTSLVTSFASMTGQQMQAAIPTINSSTNWSQSDSTELIDANAQACEMLLQRHIERLQVGRSSGWWRTAIYIAAENDAALQSVAGALKSISSGDTTSLDPIRIIALPPLVLRDAVRRGQVLSLLPASRETGHPTGHPLGESFNALATPLTSEELSVVVNLPRDEIPGLPMRDTAEYAVSVPSPDGPAIRIGTLRDGVGRDLGPVTVAAESLNRHVLVTGATGSGKSNTCMQLLLESYMSLGIPFLIIEPAKAEYRRLAQIPKLKDRLHIYTVGAVGGESRTPFRLNILSPVAGFSLDHHIDLLKAACSASFEMTAGMLTVLEDALIDVYKARGWSLSSSESPVALDERAEPGDHSAVPPTLHDLCTQIDVTLNQEEPAHNVTQAVRETLQPRLRSLMAGNRGIMFNTPRSMPVEALFEAPAVVELNELSHDEEKAFVMALLLIISYEYAKVRQRRFGVASHGMLQHLTLIEEVHRLLPITHGGSRERGDPLSAAIGKFAEMLSELRTNGEGVIMTCQTPTRLAPGALKSSSLKVVHRLIGPDDRQVIGSYINLTENQTRYLNNLKRGHAIVHDEIIGEAVMTLIDPVKDTLMPVGLD